MYAHPATRANVARLRDDFGYTVVEPEVGPLASGQVGPRAAWQSCRGSSTRSSRRSATGRCAPRTRRPAHPGSIEPPRDADLVGRHIVVTAGGTAEPIDPVRFIGNRSTGRMGVAVARAALDRGAEVTLIAANVGVALPDDARIVRVESAGQLRAALLERLAGSNGQAGLDALVMAAAVADFRPAAVADTKLTRGAGLTLELEPTPDILAEVARIAHGIDSEGAATRQALRPIPVLVGFAAETGSLERAAEKLGRKGVDLLVANDVAEAGSGFGTETNRVTLYADR